MGSSPDTDLRCLLQTALDEAPKISNCSSTVHGCPALRACPGCGALVSHTQKGCPTVWCAKCPCSFCFRCLKVGYCGYKVPRCSIKKRQRLLGKGRSQPQLSGGVTRRPAQRGSGAPGKRNRNRNGERSRWKIPLPELPDPSNSDTALRNGFVLQRQ
ncbi:unnamed protein product [Caretta caretta]